MQQQTTRQHQIVLAALEIIAEHSIQELTIKNLAHKIGISEPAIYRHFQSKLEILEAVLELFGKENEAYFLETLASNVQPIEKLRNIFSHHFEVFARQPAFAAIIFSEGIFQNEERLSQIVLSLMNLRRNTFIQIFAERTTGSRIRDDVDVDHLALMIMGTLRLLVTKWHLSKYDFDLIEEGHVVWDSLQRVICKL